MEYQNEMEINVMTQGVFWDFLKIKRIQNNSGLNKLCLVWFGLVCFLFGGWQGASETEKQVSNIEHYNPK